MGGGKLPESTRDRQISAASTLYDFHTETAGMPCTPADFSCSPTACDFFWAGGPGKSGPY